MATSNDETKYSESHVTLETEHVINRPVSEDESDDDVDEQGWEDWKAGSNNGELDEEGELEPNVICLFCDTVFTSRDEVFGHCVEVHRFDFVELRKKLGLDFYGCFKLFNYIRQQVAERKCWYWEDVYSSGKELEAGLDGSVDFGCGKYPWQDDNYLRPFLEDDALLYVFGEDEDDVDYPDEEDKEELVKEIEKLKVEGDVDDEIAGEDLVQEKFQGNGWTGRGFSSNGELKLSNGISSDQDLKVLLASGVSNEITNANRSYFGGYSSFVIHREMISDKVRTDAYREAILGNPSLFNGAVVMDVGCGTGILSLFAAQAGASRVIAVEASEKMASVATQVAKDNDLSWGKSHKQNGLHNGGIQVVHGMIEDICFADIQPNSVDVLMSEWMGYCLLYETMLNSVLLARDRWLKPGGAILPDTATMFVAGFGKGATSIPFWENVYGFNMSCIGSEANEHASKNPIVDVVDSEDIVTNSVVLKAFDLATVTPNELDFTASVELEPKSNNITWCHGLVVWFDTNFTNRFCKEKPTVLSTSPFTQKTHWSQTILTFREPVALAHGNPTSNTKSDVVIPSAKMQARISIARAAQHRSIDISMEIATIDLDGKKHHCPAQLFTL